MVRVNAIGDACPLPVIKTMNALKELGGAGTVEVLVDNEVAVQNLTRLAENKGCTIKTERVSEKEYRVTLTASGAVQQTGDEASFCTVPAAQKKIVVVISADHMGEGNDELGRILLKGFLFALTQQETLPSTILFYNGGASVTCEGSASRHVPELLWPDGQAACRRNHEYVCDRRKAAAGRSCHPPVSKGADFCRLCGGSYTTAVISYMNTEVIHKLTRKKAPNWALFFRQNREKQSALRKNSFQDNHAMLYSVAEKRNDKGGLELE